MDTDDSIILQGVVGSTAYGLDTASSDTDLLGVFQASTDHLLGLSWSTHDETHVSHDPCDSTLHELGKCCRLALAANPTILELLWLSHYRVHSLVGDDLLSLRDAFLSQRVRQTYGGYATQQLRKLVRRGDSFSPQTANRTAKRARHLRRLMFQLETLLVDGHPQIMLTDSQRDECFATGKIAETDPAALEKWFTRELARLDALDTDLPPEPDRETVEDFLIETRISAI